VDSQAREMDRQEQDSEFEMALAADQAREQAESERQTQELAAQAEAAHKQEALAAEQQLLAAQKTALIERRRQAAQNLGPEPEQGVKPASKVKCSLPDGSSLVRRFHGADSVQLLYDWVMGHECLVDRDGEIELWSSFPRKVLDPGSSISEAELCPQAMIVCQLPSEGSPMSSP